MIKIFLADDSALVRQGLKLILLDEFPDAYIEEGADGETLLSKVKTEQWSLVITDLSMPGKSGIDALKEIRQLNESLPVLIVSGHSAELYAPRLLKAGASGYLNKDSAPEELVEAVQCLLSGKKYITPSIADYYDEG